MEGEGDKVRGKVGGDEGRMELRLKVRRWRVNRRQDTTGRKGTNLLVKKA